MKIISLLITSVFLFSLGAGVLAQETELPDPGLTPDSPFYFLERITERIGTFFTFGDIKKAERHTVLATERLAEANAMREKGKSELVEKTLERYEYQLEKALSRTEQAKTKGKNTVEVAKTITEATQKHLTVLEEILEEVPEEVKPAIEQAMTVSSRGSERASEASFSPPPESSESPRAFCLGLGVPPEACETVPLESFESFEAIEAFCLETGAPPEGCALLVPKCKEEGATTPDECFRFLSTASLKAFQELAPTARIQPTTEEFEEFEEMEEKRIQREAEEERSRTIKLQTPEGTIEIPTEGLEEGTIKILGEDGRFIEIHSVKPEGEE